MAFRTRDHHGMIITSRVGSASTPAVVMPGLDPGSHRSSEESLGEEDGLPGQVFCPAMTRNLLPVYRKTLERVLMSSPLQIGLVLFPRVTQLDLTGPVQVFSSVPGAQVHLIWKRIEPVPTDSLLVLTPTITFADCPQLDVICVPGGVGTDDMVNDEEMLDFLRRQSVGAKYITSVCTGSLVLGAAGLLRGYRATTHWTAMDWLPAPRGAPAETPGCA